MRKSGILMPISALPSKYGIGCFSKEAYAFVDQLKASGQSLWQILPLGPTGYGDSPYQSFSTYAGNPYYIDLEELIREGLLTEEQCKEAYSEEETIDYEHLYLTRFRILRSAFERAKEQGMLREQGYHSYQEKESYWLSDYALYTAVKNHFGGRSWEEWEEDIRVRRPEALAHYRVFLAEEVEFCQFQQYLFYLQWNRLKEYANHKGIRIVGDIPIYVALDSADTWANPKLFQLDEHGRPKDVAGCPPDQFSEIGQVWGNPLYDWEYHMHTGYAWWQLRIAYCFRLYDILRIDHFRGFDEYYAIPYGDTHARNGEWRKGPGMELFRALKEGLGDFPIIAEDLGFLTDSVKQLLADSGYPGMKVLQFAFDSRESGDYLPHKYGTNCVVYTGTHDNDTILGWYEAICEADREYAETYLNNYASPIEEIPWDYICLAMRSVADTCIIPLQDYLGLGTEARINVPSTLGGNWCWRMKKGAFTEKLAERIYRITKVTGRF